MIFKNNVNSYIAVQYASTISPKCMQRYKYINMVQVKKKRYNELKYRGKKKSIIMLEIQRNIYISEQLNKDTEIFDTKNINLYFSLLGGFFV